MSYCFNPSSTRVCITAFTAVLRRSRNGGDVLFEWHLCYSHGGRDSVALLDLNFNLTSEPWIRYQNTVPSGLSCAPVRAQEHKVNIIQLGSGIETAIIFNSRTENPIIWSSLWQMERQPHPLPFLSKPIWWLEPQLWGERHNGGRGQKGGKVSSLFVLRERCLLKPELGQAAPSPPHSPVITIEPAWAVWSPQTVTAVRWSDRWRHPMRTTFSYRPQKTQYVWGQILNVKK